jgi:hypothetical protein
MEFPEYNGVIWLSCLEKARAIPEIVELWNVPYDYEKQFDLDAKKMVKAGLLTGNGYFFQSSFDQWFDLMPANPDKKDIEKDWEVWRQVLSRDSVRQKLFPTLLLKTLYRDDWKLPLNEGGYVPFFQIFWLSLEATCPHMVDKFQYSNEMVLIPSLSFPRNLSFQIFPLMQSQMQVLKEQDLTEWNHVLDLVRPTEYAQTTQVRAMKMLNLSVSGIEKIKRLWKAKNRIKNFLGFK